MILTNIVEIIGNSKNIKYYNDKGIIIKIGEKIKININDLSHGSTFKIDVKCDNCDIIKSIQYGVLIKYIGDINNAYYCNKCNKIKRMSTNIIKYGGNSPACDKLIVQKIKDTNLKKYGNNSSLHGSQQEKTNNNFLNKYGTKTPSKLAHVKEKMKNTNIIKYGGIAPACDKKIMDKIKNTNIEKYGYDNVSKNEDIKNKVKSIFIGKYGMYYTETDDMKNKSKETSFKKYGVFSYSLSEIFKEKVIRNKSDKYNINIISYKGRMFNIKCNLCDNVYEISTDNVYNRYRKCQVLCTECNPIEQ